ncbi:phospholipase [Microbacterium sp.]|uniref:aggregation-promoting factor C-terminal-like domain-containing protein n=1 Tax=Microbacterium sp. TaxID=51671 RepID=UPI0039E703BB
MTFSRSVLARPALALALTVPLLAGVAAAAAPPSAAAVGTSSVSASEVTPAAFAAREVSIDATLGKGAMRAHIDERAAAALREARLTVAATQGKVSGTELSAAIDALSGFADKPAEQVDMLADALERETDRVQEQAVGVELTTSVRGIVGDLDQIGTQAQATAAAQAQAIAEAEARAAAEAAAAAARAQMLAQVNTPDGARAYARDLAASQYGWGDGEFQCLDSLWNKESGWNYLAYNDSSGATGIPQALPGSKMATFGDDWQTNAATQIAWGLDYIANVYGSPCSAWGHSQSTNWY